MCLVDCGMYSRVYKVYVIAIKIYIFLVLVQAPTVWRGKLFFRGGEALLF